MSRRVSASPTAEIPTIAGLADPRVVSAIELLAQRSQHVAAEFADVLAKVGALENAKAPLSASEIKTRLQVNGGYALDVTGLLGVLAQPQKAGVPLVNELPPATATNNVK